MLERRRGAQAKLRLQTLIESAKTVHLIPWQTAVSSEDREFAVLLVDGWDVATIAQREHWGVPYDRRAEIDWGQPSQPFADHLPVPEAGGLPPDPFFDDEMAARFGRLHARQELPLLDLDAPELTKARNSLARELVQKAKLRLQAVISQARHAMAMHCSYADMLIEFIDGGKAAKGALLRFLARRAAAHASRLSAMRERLARRAPRHRGSLPGPPAGPRRGPTSVRSVKGARKQ